MPRRGTKRKGPQEEMAAQLNEPEGKRPHVIDFEEIIRASNILVPEPGCGVSMQMPQPQIEENLPGHSFNNSTMHTPGIRLANDDLAIHIPHSLKNQIQRGDYINLALLLKGAVDLAEFGAGNVVRLCSDGTLETRQRECREKIDTIERWTDAFTIYMSVYLSSYPEKTLEILHYMYNIRECAKYQGGGAWKVYDEQFRLRQAANPTPWSQINNDLWWRCMQVNYN